MEQKQVLLLVAHGILAMEAKRSRAGVAEMDAQLESDKERQRALWAKAHEAKREAEIAINALPDHVFDHFARLGLSRREIMDTWLEKKGYAPKV